MANIGFIGLGHMGLPMAINLVKAGHQVTGFDLNTSAMLMLEHQGGIQALTLSAASQNQDLFITMLQTGAQVEQVCQGNKGLFAAAKPSAIFIDCSSIDVDTSRALQAEANRCHLLSLDAPVSGGVKGAASGSLTIMVGGDETTFIQAKPILELLGKTIIHTGKTGTGQAAKICNNMMLGIAMIATSEAFTLADHLGLTPQKLFEVVTHSSGQCWAMSQYVPVPGILDSVPANRDYQAGFTAAMMLKDLRLSQASARTSGIKTPLGEQATQLYQQFYDTGSSELDFSAIIKLIQAIHTTD